jgi:hypothetical protein
MLEQCCFTGAILAYYGDKLAGPDLEIDVVQNQESA